ncbi:MAG: PilZ domain-containing protein [Fuerstiella sp.]|jgi:hypothetical protein|nr:PilZ domain-containing protein [Fuerstiella sp.]
MVRNSNSERGENTTARLEPDTHAPVVLFEERLDCRLTTGKIPDISVHVTCRDKTAVTCDVRAIGSQELVLIAPNHAGTLAARDLVTFSISEDGSLLLTNQSGIAHWTRPEGDKNIVALFSGSRLDRLLDHGLLHERRADVRYPVNLQAVLIADHFYQDARIVNYSLHGLCLVSATDLELNRHYQTDVFCEEGSLRLSATPQWTRRITGGHLIGCALTPQYGMLLTCRHKALSAGLNGDDSNGS